MENMTWQELETKIKETKTVIIPLGSTEEHGHHLPLSTDYLLAYEIAKRVGEKSGALVAPPICYGVCRRTASFPGTVTISFDTLRSLVTDLVESLYSQGLRNMLILPGHLGSAQLVGMEISAQALLSRHNDLSIAIADLPKILKKLPNGLIEEPFGHAGEVETSMMLACKPEFVRTDRLEREIPVFPSHLITRNSRDYMKSGIMGDATKATREKGEAILNLLVNDLCELVNQLEKRLDRRRS